MRLTAQARLLPTAEQAESLLATMKAVNAAATEASQIGFENHVYGQVSIHRLAYFRLRERYGLPAQHAVRAIAKAVEAFARDKGKCSTFQPTAAIPLDNRLYRLIGLQTADVSTVHGRIRLPFVCGDYFRPALERKRGEADLVYRGGKFFLYISVEFDDPPPVKPVGALGVDFGIVNLATTDAGETFSGKDVDAARRKSTRARSTYQRRGTRNARRRLRKLSGRQSRFQKHTNHTIAKRLVARAKALNYAIGLEDLSGIRGRTEKTVSRTVRRLIGNWSFYHLRVCIEYKAKRVGIPVIAVDPRNTSRTCSACGHCDKGNRKSQGRFSCLACGYTTHADQNGAANIRSRALGVLVSNPELAAVAG